MPLVHYAGSGVLTVTFGEETSVSGFFFFRAEDGIRDLYVTGVQTCALPISPWPERRVLPAALGCAVPEQLIRHGAGVLAERPRGRRREATRPLRKKNDKNLIERSVPRPFWPPWSTTPRGASAETARVTNVANRRFFVAYLT